MRCVYGVVGVLFFLLSWERAAAQLLPANQPEQDACNALRMCGPSMHIPYSYQGEGRVRDMAATPCGGGEGNSMWIQLDILTAGAIVFTITPSDPLDDYDFAIVAINDKSCDSMRPTDVIRCNFNNNLTSGSGYIGPVVGLDYISTAPFVNAGFSGGNFLQAIQAQAGDRYLLMINNFGYGGGPASGFTIDFEGSTAVFAHEGVPLYDSFPDICAAAGTSGRMQMGGNVLCSSIAADGSDFVLDPPLASVRQASGAGCSGADGYARDIQLTFDRALPPGRYVIRPQTGTDGNTLLDLCGMAQPLTDSFVFTVNDPQLDPGDNRVTCEDHSVQLQASVSGVSGAYAITWQPARYLDAYDITNPVCTPGSDITYTVVLTPADNPACVVTETITVELLDAFRLQVNDTAICSGDMFRPDISGDSRYRYDWLPVSGVSDPGAARPVLAPDTTTAYRIRAAYPGCRDTVLDLLVEVDRSRALTAFLFQADSTLCAGVPVRFTPQADSFVQSVAWDFGDGTARLQAMPMQQVTHTYAGPGDYEVQMIASFRICPDSIYALPLTVHDVPPLDLGPDTNICAGMDPLELRNLADAENDSRYVWNTGASTPQLLVDEPGVYRLELYSGAGCVNSDSVTVSSGCFLEVPNVFTPDANGYNDYFLSGRSLALIKGAVRFRAQIYNRWGQEVYASADPLSHGWNGRYKGEPVAPGVYVYSVEVYFRNGRRAHYQGNVTLLR